MQVQVRSNHTVTGGESLTAEVQAEVQAALGHHADRVTRVEVHLQDVNAGKGGERDKRCAMEAHVGGLAPIAVTHEAGSFRAAIDGAAEKLDHAVGHALGRIAATAGRSPPEGQIVTTEELDHLPPARDRR